MKGAKVFCLAVIGWLLSTERSPAPVIVLPEATPTPKAGAKRGPPSKPKPARVHVTPPPIKSENDYAGNVGPYEARFTLRINPEGRVTGSYFLAVDRGLTLRLEGSNPPGELLLKEYTRDQLSANIYLKRVLSPTEIRWEGTMRNTPPDNRTFAVVLRRPRS